MKKTYLLMFALMLTMLGISDAMAQKIYRAERAASPLSEVNVSASYDVIRVDFGVTTNLKDLVKASPSNTLVFDNSTVSVDIDGEPIEVLSVEGYEDGNLYIFIEDDYYGDAEMKVAFRNPEDDAHRLVFTSGNWEGEAVPEFSGIVASFDQDLGNAGYVSYLYAPPALLEISPEAGSFNLPGDLNEFTVTFNQPVKIGSVFAMLDEELLIVSGEYEDVFSDDYEYAKVIKLTRSSDEELSGTKNLVIYSAEGKGGSAFGLQEPIVVKYSFGPVVLDSDDQPAVIYESNFSYDGEDALGAGWYANAGDALQPVNSGSGCRIMHNQGAFAEDLVYIAQRDAANGGVAIYGIDDENKLTLEGGKTYHVTVKACRHDRDNVALRVQVLPKEAVDAENGSIWDEYAILAEDFKAITPEKSSKQFVAFDLQFTPSEDGNYVIRLVPSLENGSFAGYNDPVCFGDVKVEYVPDALGVVENKQLAEALQSAKDAYNELTMEEYEGRYEGEDLIALENLIAEVEADMTGYTAPSVFVAKAEELAAAVKVANDHKTACDTYDTYIKKAIDIVTDYAESKFNITETYQQLESIVMRYNGFKFVMEDYFGEEEEPVWITNYTFDVLTDNADLNSANEELGAAVALGEYVFTEVALDADIQQGNCGIAVLVERNRLGARTLMSLGVEESDPLIEAVKNSVTDDDDLAGDIKARITNELYSKLKEADNDVFGPQIDEFGDPVMDDAGEIVNKSYDMTAFIKNPNIYALNSAEGFSETNVPGWTCTTYNKPTLFTAWSARNVPNLPEDCAFTTWYGTNRMEQTITDLPAGIYVVSLCGSNWSNQEDNPHDVNSFVYCKTSDTPAVEAGVEEDRDLNFAATRTIVYGGQWSMDHAHNLGYTEVIDEETGLISTEDGEFFGIPVRDGKLTFGINFAGDAQYFFQHVKLTMVAPLEGFDYAAAYNGEEPIEEWVDIIVNGDMEEESTECFYVTEQGWGGPYLANITDGIGTDGSRAIMVQSAKNPSNSGDSQFFIRLPYQIPAGTPYRVTFDYKATQEAYYTTQAHGEPGSYIYWRAIGNGSFENYWQTYEMEGVVTSDMSQDGNMMQTIAFNLAEDSRAIQYIFDNIKFEVPASVLESLVWNPAVDPNPYPMFKMGDVNADREVNITDVVLIIEDILEREPQNYNAELADVNYDGWIDVSDVVMVIDAILGKVTLSRGAEPIDRSAYTAFQMDLTIPAGYVLESVSLTDIAKDSHSLAYTKLPDGRCRVVVCSMNNEALPGTWDEVIRLNLRGNGDAQVNIDRAVFVTIDGERHELMMNPTSIAEISTLNSQTSNLYDLQGRKVEKNAKGILIENGRKTVIK